MAHTARYVSGSKHRLRPRVSENKNGDSIQPCLALVSNWIAGSLGTTRLQLLNESDDFSRNIHTRALPD